MSQDIVILTEAASLQIKDMMKHNEEDDAFLRVSVKGGGCSGLSYGMGFDHEVGEVITSLNSLVLKCLSIKRVRQF